MDIELVKSGFEAYLETLVANADIIANATRPEMLYGTQVYRLDPRDPKDPSIRYRVSQSSLTEICLALEQMEQGLEPQPPAEPSISITVQPGDSETNFRPRLIIAGHAETYNGLLPDKRFSFAPDQPPDPEVEIIYEAIVQALMVPLV